VELVSGNYFQVLGIKPAIGRFLVPDEDTVPTEIGSGGDACILAEALRRIAGIIGKTLRLNGHPFHGYRSRRSNSFSVRRPGFGPDAWAPLMRVEAFASGVQPDLPNPNYVELFAGLAEGTAIAAPKRRANRRP